MLKQPERLQRTMAGWCWVPLESLEVVSAGRALTVHGDVAAWLAVVRLVSVSRKSDLAFLDAVAMDSTPLADWL